MNIIRKIAKIAAVSLAALILVANVTALADLPAAENFSCEVSSTLSEASAEKPLRFVLMLDVSRTMSRSDPRGYGRDAAGMFACMLPAEKAEVSVFSFGHEGEASYDYAPELMPVTPENGRFVQMLVPFTDAGKVKGDMEDLMAGLSENGGQSPIEAALLAGTDVLLKDGTGGRACVILVTDGDYKSRYITDPLDPERDIARAVDVLSENGWNAYCIELDYANNEGKREEANRFLVENITEKTGGRTYQVAKAADVGKAYMEIIDSFLGTGKMQTRESGPGGSAAFSFEIPELASEANITINADPLTPYVYLGYHGEAIPFEAKWGDTWCNIVLEDPIPGTLDIDAGSQPGAEVTANVITFTEVTPQASFLPEENPPETPLSKTDSLTAAAVLSGAAGNLKKENLGGITAVLLVTGPDGKTTEYPMEFDERTGMFQKEMPFSNVGKSGRTKASVEIRTTDGRVLTAGEAVYHTKNSPVIKKTGASVDLTDYVHGKETEIPAGTLFSDPDGETLFAKLDLEGPVASLSKDGKTLTVLPGDVPGDHEGTLKVWDADMGETGAITIPVHVNVQNHPLTAGRLSDLNMTTAYVKEAEIDVKGLFSDEDQPELMAALKGDYDGEVLEANLSDGMLHLSAKTDGTTKVTLYAVDDDGKEVTTSFTVKGATDSSIRRQKLAVLFGKLGAAGIVLAVLAVIAILVILLKKANSKIRGEWKVTVTVPDCDPWKVTVDAGAELPKKERHQTDLFRLLDLDDRSSRNPVVKYLQENEHILKKVKITGAAGCSGKLAVTAPVVMRIDGGRPVTTAKLSSCEAELTVDRDDVVMKIIIAT